MKHVRVLKILIWLLFGLAFNLWMSNVIISDRAGFSSSPSAKLRSASPLTDRMTHLESIPESNEVAKRFHRRLVRLRKICADNPRPSSKDWKAVREFLVDVPRRLLVCAVPKSGSTSWHRLIWSIRRRRLKLSDDQSLYTPDDTIQNEAITQNLNKKEGDKLISSVNGDDDFTRNPPPNSTFRVILARHPFARFISGWNQKFLPSIDYWRKLFKTFPKLLQYKNDVDPGRVVSFVDFARFAAENPRDVQSKDAHFVPATKLCSPCEYDYTYVIKAENIDADQPWLLKRLGLSDVDLGRQGSPGNGSVVNDHLKENIKKFMSRLNPDVITGLYELYKDDFDFFGYTFDFETLEAGGFEVE